MSFFTFEIEMNFKTSSFRFIVFDIVKVRKSQKISKKSPKKLKKCFTNFCPRL